LPCIWFRAISPADRIFKRVEAGAPENVALLHGALETAGDLFCSHATSQLKVSQGKAGPFATSTLGSGVGPSYRLLTNFKDDLDDGYRLKREQRLHDPRDHDKAPSGRMGETIALDRLEHDMEAGDFICPFATRASAWLWALK